MTSLKPAVFAALGLLAACATPEERCAGGALRELRTVNELIAESERNLSRGFALEQEVDVSPRLTFCTGVADNVAVSFCTGDRLVRRERPVAIDPDAERRKLAALQERKRALETVVRRRLAACG